MHYSKIEAATARSLFDVHHENASLCGRAGKTGPRAAVAQEIRAYAEWLASKAGLYPFNASEVIGGGMAWRAKHHDPVMGVTYGERRGINAETRQYDYEPGSYSVPFPGRNAHRDVVTMETLDDDGNVIASSSLPVEPKKGGVIWDKATVHKAVGKVSAPSRGKRAAPPSVKIEEAPAATEPVSIPDELPAPDLASQVAALAATVEEMRRQFAVLSTGTAEATTPIEEMTTQPPVSGKRERTAAHERMIRRAWAERQTRREAQREVLALRASVEYQDRRFEARTRHLTAQLEAKHTNMEKWAAEARRGRKAATKRRRAVILARDLQKRLNAEHRLVDKQIDAKREMLEDMLAMRNQIIALKSKPHHLGQAVNPDDYQRLVRERDEARASLASDREKLRIMRANLERGTDALNMMVERALRAENALRVVEQRQARADAPYRANVRAVTFDIAA